MEKLKKTNKKSYDLFWINFYDSLIRKGIDIDNSKIEELYKNDGINIEMIRKIQIKEFNNNYKGKFAKINQRNILGDDNSKFLLETKLDFSKNDGYIFESTQEKSNYQRKLKNKKNTNSEIENKFENKNLNDLDNNVNCDKNFNFNKNTRDNVSLIGNLKVESNYLIKNKNEIKYKFEDLTENNIKENIKSGNALIDNKVFKELSDLRNDSKDNKNNHNNNRQTLKKSRLDQNNFLQRTNMGVLSNYDLKFLREFVPCENSVYTRDKQILLNTLLKYYKTKTIRVPCSTLTIIHQICLILDYEEDILIAPETHQKKKYLKEKEFEKNIKPILIQFYNLLKINESTFNLLAEYKRIKEISHKCWTNVYDYIVKCMINFYQKNNIEQLTWNKISSEKHMLLIDKLNDFHLSLLDLHSYQEKNLYIIKNYDSKNVVECVNGYDYFIKKIPPSMEKLKQVNIKSYELFWKNFNESLIRKGIKIDELNIKEMNNTNDIFKKNNEIQINKFNNNYNKCKITEIEKEDLEQEDLSCEDDSKFFIETKMIQSKNDEFISTQDKSIESQFNIDTQSKDELCYYNKSHITDISDISDINYNLESKTNSKIMSVDKSDLDKQSKNENNMYSDSWNKDIERMNTDQLRQIIAHLIKDLNAEKYRNELFKNELNCENNTSNICDTLKHKLENIRVDSTKQNKKSNLINKKNAFRQIKNQKEIINNLDFLITKDQIMFDKINKIKNDDEKDILKNQENINDSKISSNIKINKLNESKELDLNKNENINIMDNSNILKNNQDFDQKLYKQPFVMINPSINKMNFFTYVFKNVEFDKKFMDNLERNA